MISVMFHSTWFSSDALKFHEGGTLDCNGREKSWLKLLNLRDNDWLLTRLRRLRCCRDRRAWKSCGWLTWSQSDVLGSRRVGGGIVVGSMRSILLCHIGSSHLWLQKQSPTANSIISSTISLWIDNRIDSESLDFESASKSHPFCVLGPTSMRCAKRTFSIASTSTETISEWNFERHDVLELVVD